MYRIYVERNGVRTEFLGNDDELLEGGSFIVVSGSAQAVVECSEGYCDAWARVPVDRDAPLGSAKMGNYLGQVRSKEDFPRIWEAYSRPNGRPDVAAVPSPYGAGDLGGAVVELIR